MKHLEILISKKGFLIVALICADLIYPKNAIPQWKRVQGVEGYFSCGIKTDSNNIWMGGGSGKLANYDLDKNTFEYFEIGDLFGINSIEIINDTIVALAGINHLQENGFLGFVSRFDIKNNYLIDTILLEPGIYDLEFTSVDTGYAVGFGGIYKTIDIDSGESWDSLFHFPQFNFEWGTFYSITSTNSNILYVAGELLNIDDFRGIVLKSTDQGASWEILFDEIPYLKLDNIGVVESDHNPNLLYCHDKSDPVLYRSYDGGINWKIDTLPVHNSLLSIYDFVFQDEDSIYVLLSQRVVLTFNELQYTQHQILKSVDSGKTWMIQYEAFTPTPIDSTFSDFILGENGKHYVVGWNQFLISENEGGRGPILSKKNIESFQSMLKLYPNPAKDYLTIRSNHYEVHYTLFNLFGIKIRSGIIPKEKQIFIGDLKPGVYLISVTTEQNTKASQIFMKL